ncbi:MAG: hypothetical protein HYR76_09755 [Ignavibacteria bacterium]|nr:hypothetical protein [Ignavibacteria bacterium]
MNNFLLAQNSKLILYPSLGIDVNIRISIFIFLAIVVTGFQKPQKKTQSKFQLLFVGNYHAGEISANSGETWYGLFPSESGYELLATKIMVKAAHDIIVDQDPSQQSGLKVSVDQPSRPLFLVKGPFPFKNGSIKSVFSGHQYLTSIHHLILNLGDTIQYNLTTTGELIEGHSSFTNFKVNLTFGKIHQTVATMRGTDEDGPPSILWAGDLDRDGKLDLLLDLTNHYNASEPTLFLSSQATEGKLVAKVASHRSVGC